MLYTVVFLIVGAIGTVDFIIQISVYDIAGIGFYMGAFASVLFFVE
jgi:hypothetical protein